MPIVVIVAGALAQAVEESVAALEDGGGDCRRWWMAAFFWKLRVKIRRQVARVTAAGTCRCTRRSLGGRGGRSAAPRFYYDPFSYALNFDDGVATLFPTLLTIVSTAKGGVLLPAADHASLPESNNA